MRRLGVLLIALAVGCGGPAVASYATASDLVDAIAEDCETINRAYDDTWGCDLADGSAYVAQTDLDEASIAYFIAMSMDRGDPGPWVIGEDWVVSFVDARAGLPERVAEAAGGEVVTGPPD